MDSYQAHYDNVPSSTLWVGKFYTDTACVCMRERERNGERVLETVLVVWHL